MTKIEKDRASVIQDSGVFFVPVSALVRRTPKECKTKDLRNFAVDEMTKMALVMSLAVGDLEEKPDWEAVTIKKPDMFDSEQILLWSVLCQWTFENASVQVYPAELSQVLYQVDKVGCSEEDSTENAKECLRKYIHSGAHQKHVFPIFSATSEEELGSGGASHWTLLVESCQIIG